MVKKNPLRTRESRGAVFLLLRTIQNLQSYGLCGILDIEKDNRPQGGLPRKKVLESHFFTRKV